MEPTYDFLEAIKIGCEDGHVLMRADCKINGVASSNCRYPGDLTYLTSKLLKGKVKRVTGGGESIVMKVEDEPQYAYCKPKLDFSKEKNRQCHCNGIARTEIPCFYEGYAANNCVPPKNMKGLRGYKTLSTGLQLDLDDESCLEDYSLSDATSLGCSNKGKMIRAPCYRRDGKAGNRCKQIPERKDIIDVLDQQPTHIDLLIDHPDCYGKPDWDNAVKGNCITGQKARSYKVECNRDCHSTNILRPGDRFPLNGEEVIGSNVVGKTMKLAVNDKTCDFGYQHPPDKLCTNGFSNWTYYCRRVGSNNSTPSCGVTELEQLMTNPELREASIYSKHITPEKAVFKIDDPRCRPRYNYDNATEMCVDGKRSYIVPCEFNGKPSTGCKSNIGPKDTVTLNGSKKTVNEIADKCSSLQITVADRYCENVHPNYNEGIDLGRDGDVQKYRFACRHEDGKPAVCVESQLPKEGDTLLNRKVSNVTITSDPMFVEVELVDPDYQYKETDGKLIECIDGYAKYEFQCQDKKGKILDSCPSTQGGSGTCTTAQLPKVGDKFKDGTVESFREEGNKLIMYVKDSHCLPKFDMENSMEEVHNGRRRYIIYCKNRQGRTTGCKLESVPAVYKGSKIYQTAVAEDGSEAIIDVDRLIEGFSRVSDNSRWFWLIFFVILIVVMFKIK